ncbi:MAG: exodeoxyribonuclease VII small subunit [Oscillospiraceae bacterium]|nr:exodeoxyribonuclease VII small subunit [Oscillospiraceae bacterium]
MAETKKKLSFEQQMARIEEIVRALEKGDRPLEEALSLFEEGTALIKSCGTLLNEAEQRVVKLQKGEDGEPVELPFETIE